MDTQCVRYNQRITDKSVTAFNLYTRNGIVSRCKLPRHGRGTVLSLCLLNSTLCCSWAWMIFFFFWSRNGSSILRGFLLQLEGSGVLLFLVVTCLNEPLRIQIPACSSLIVKVKQSFEPWSLSRSEGRERWKCPPAVSVASPVPSWFPSLWTHSRLTSDIQELLPATFPL